MTADLAVDPSSRNRGRRRPLSGTAAIVLFATLVIGSAVGAETPASQAAARPVAASRPMSMDMADMPGMKGMQANALGAGRALAAKACAQCHGADGKGTLEDYPILAGQDAMYLMASLQAYRSGDRDAQPMNGVAAKLSDQDIDAVSMYYAQCRPGLR